MYRSLLITIILAGCSAQEPDPGGRHDDVHGSTPASTATQSTIPRTPAPAGARVFIREPHDGATVVSPVHIEFGAENVDIVAAGTRAPDSGHHHLIVNAELPDENAPIPATAQYIHFGDGSTSTELELPPGEHRLRLLLGDHLHVPHDPPVYSDAIRIVVRD